MWRPLTIDATIEIDSTYLKVGQYLRLTNEPRGDEFGWTESKVDLPDTWRVEKLEFQGTYLTFQIQTKERFAIKPPKLNELDFKILNGGNKSDQELEMWWRKYALVED